MPLPRLRRRAPPLHDKHVQAFTGSDKVCAEEVSTREILGVDPGTNKVAFQQADGSQHVIAVKSPNMQKFIRTLKAGDNVEVTYTESVAVSVTPSS